MKSIPIVLATDNKYAEYGMITVLSIIESSKNKNQLIDIHIIYTSLNPIYIRAYLSLRTTNVNIILRKIDSLPKDGKMYRTSYFSMAMYYRLMIPEIFHECEKVIYLDCDLLVLGNITELMKTDMHDYVLAAVPEFQDKELRDYLIFTRQSGAKYFNSGVLVINLDMFRSQNVAQRCFEELSKTQKYMYPDQDALNIVCKDIYYPLQSKWNVKPVYDCLNIQFLDESDNVQYKADLENPEIIHFTSRHKPWLYRDIKYSTEWWKYADKLFHQDSLCDKLIALHLHIKYYLYTFARKCKAIAFSHK